MLASAELSPAIAHWLAGVWSGHRSDQFLDYLAETYGKRVDRPPSFDCIYIAEAEEGDLDSGRIGGIIKKWWKVDNVGLTEVRRPNLPATDEPGLFDQRPVLKFFTDGKRVVIGERLGPKLICRKAGKVEITEASVGIVDVRIIWMTND
jgi:hypothetical protein